MLNFLNVSKKVKYSKPVFIVGEARSGTSLLNRTLELHSVFKPKRIIFIESKIFSHINYSHKLLADKNCSLYKYMIMNKPVFQSFLRSIRLIQTFHKIFGKYRIFKILSNKYLFFYILFLNHYVFRAFIYFSKKARESHRIVEKTPNNTPHISKIKYTFPYAKILYIYRHPVDVYSSYRKVAQREGGISWANISIKEFCSIYKDRTEKILYYKNIFPEDILLINYEKFIAFPETEFQNICIFLNVPFEKAPIQIKKLDNYKRPEPYITKEIARKTKKWQKYLTINEAKLIENKLYKIMKKLKINTYL